MIKVNDITKEFRGFQALKGLSMHVKAGEVYGFIGQNGAGKTTTMNILAGLSRPTGGKCVVNRKDVAQLKYPGDLNIGYLPEDPKFYPWMSARETLFYLSDTQNTKCIQEILQWTGLAKESERRVGGFSQGMKQRLGIGAALIRNPELLVLDEPSSALDPEGRSEVLHKIKDLRNMGKTILFSTHILDDVERICDTVGMVDKGQMLFEKPLELLLKEHNQPIYDIMPLNYVEPNILNVLSQIKGVLSLTKSENTLTVRVVDSLISIEVMRFLEEHKIAVKSFTMRKRRLEDLFLKEVSEK